MTDTTLIDITEQNHQLLAERELINMLDGKRCVICSKPFANKPERDDAVYAGKDKDNLMTFAHGHCWPSN